MLLFSGWIMRKIEESELSLVEFLRRNPDGIPFQVWKDSGTSFMHVDGTLANWDAPIAAIEVQAYAYDALLGAGELLRQSDWQARAARLREQIFGRLWMPEQAYFAMGIDRRRDGASRLVDSIASNGALALDTRLLDGLPEAEEYVAGLARRVCGSDFLTRAGTRCRARSEADLVDFQDYHGSWTVWPKETFAVVRGLDRHGLRRLARQIGNRLLNAVNVAQGNVEFLYVSPDGLVMYDFRSHDVRSTRSQPIAGTNQPESPAAWTVSAVTALKAWYGQGVPLHATTPPRDAWRGRLEDEILGSMPRVDVHRTRAQIERDYAGRGDFTLDLELGREKDREARINRRVLS